MLLFYVLVLFYNSKGRGRLPARHLQREQTPWPHCYGRALVASFQPASSSPSSSAPLAVCRLPPPCESDTATNPSPPEARLLSRGRVPAVVLLRPVRVDVGVLDKSKKNTAAHARTYFCRHRDRTLGPYS